MPHRWTTFTPTFSIFEVPTTGFPGKLVDSRLSASIDMNRIMKTACFPPHLQRRSNLVMFTVGSKFTFHSTDEAQWRSQSLFISKVDGSPEDPVTKFVAKNHRMWNYGGRGALQIAERDCLRRVSQQLYVQDLLRVYQLQLQTRFCMERLVPAFHEHLRHAMALKVSCSSFSCICHQRPIIYWCSSLN